MSNMNLRHGFTRIADGTTDTLLLLQSMISKIWVADVEIVHCVLKSVCLHNVLGLVFPLEVVTLCYVDPLTILLN